MWLWLRVCVLCCRGCVCVCVCVLGVRKDGVKTTFGQCSLRPPANKAKQCVVSTRQQQCTTRFVKRNESHSLTHADTVQCTVYTLAFMHRHTHTTRTHTQCIYDCIHSILTHHSFSFTQSKCNNALFGPKNICFSFSCSLHNTFSEAVTHDFKDVGNVKKV